MKKNTRALLTLAAIAVFGSGIYSLCGNREGNGGDHVRSTFIKSGKAVVQFLRNKDQGMEIVSKHQLDVDRLEAGLDIEKITVVEGPLIDNGGSDADALGEPGKITLRKDRWYDHFEKDRDVYYLVFHEMLRQAGVNDDNYVISADLRPFPSSDRVVTRIANYLPIISTDDILPFISLNVNSLVLNGSGCHLNDVFLDLDTEKGVLDVAFEIYRALGTTDRKTCDVRLAVNNRAQKRLVISQVDMLGRVSLPAGASTSIALRPNLGTTLGTQVRKVVSGSEFGRFHLRTTPNFATSCEDSSTILGLNTNVALQSPTGDAAVNVDRLSIYFRAESCSNLGEGSNRSR